MVRHFQEEEALPALPDLPKAVKVASYFILECEMALNPIETGLFEHI